MLYRNKEKGLDSESVDDLVEMFQGIEDVELLSEKRALIRSLVSRSLLVVLVVLYIFAMIPAVLAHPYDADWKLTFVLVLSLYISFYPMWAIILVKPQVRRLVCIYTELDIREIYIRRNVNRC